MSHVWTFEHPETGCLCRAEFDGSLLLTEVTAGPIGLEADDWDDYDDAICETLNDLEKAGVRRTAIASAAAAERELRLIADAIREIESC